MKKILLMLGLSLVFALGLAACGSSDSGAEDEAAGDDAAAEITVTAENGTYIGHDNDGVAEFLGIQYGTFDRWKAPGDLETTSEDEFVCDEWGPSCIQPDDDVEVASQWKQDENCLQLNVWTRDPNTEGKPVMMFIHGGGAWQGGTEDPLYDGEYFIRNLPEGEDCVFITINYRLGIIGSLDLSLLEGYTDEYADSTNLAIRDQIQALKWINKNVAAFGGDPENVTIFGQSAGGGACNTLMTIPEANKYFKNVILESGVIFNRQVSPEKCAENSQKAFDIMGVKSIDDLMAITGEEIHEKYAADLMDEIGTPQRVADGVIIPENGYLEIKNGIAADKNVMIGTTNGEYDFYSIDWDKEPYMYPLEDNEYVMGKVVSNGEKSGDTPSCWTVHNDQNIVDEYMALGDDPLMRAQDLFNDSQYRQVSIYMAEALSAAGSDVYMYYWKWAPDPAKVCEDYGEDAEVSPWGRAMHCMEVVFAFGTTKEGYDTLAGKEEDLPMDLVEKTMATWYAFAKTGNPNNDTMGVEWPTYNADSRDTMVINEDTTWKVESDPRSEDRKVLDQKRPTGE